MKYDDLEEYWKFYGFLSLTDWTYFYILPSITIVRNEIRYGGPTFRISIGWLGFHFSWLWIQFVKKKEEK